MFAGLVWFLLAWQEIGSAEKKPHLWRSFYQIGLWACHWESVWIANWCRKAQSTLGGTIPRQGVLKCIIRKLAECKPVCKPASKRPLPWFPLYFFGYYVNSLVSGNAMWNTKQAVIKSLPWVPALTFSNHGPWPGILSGINPFLHPVAFGQYLSQQQKAN